MPWVDEAGEVGECPVCAGQDAQVSKMERELRAMRGKLTKLERDADRQLVAKRDGALWKRLLDYWLHAFPDKKPSARGIKSARATKCFLRLESGAMPDHIELAIDGARLYPYVVYGKRSKTGGAGSLSDDLQEIVHVGQDHLFDFLVNAGREARKAGQLA